MHYSNYSKTQEIKDLLCRLAFPSSRRCFSLSLNFSFSCLWQTILLQFSSSTLRSRSEGKSVLRLRSFNIIQSAMNTLDSWSCRPRRLFLVVSSPFHITQIDEKHFPTFMNIESATFVYFCFTKQVWVFSEGVLKGGDEWGVEWQGAQA